MFTGIIETTGHITSIEQKGGDSRFVFDVGTMDLADIKIGDSIAVNGVCVTVVAKEGGQFSADLSKETLSLTTFAQLAEGAFINLEKAMQLSDRLNGHLVSGHVDGVGSIIEQAHIGRSIAYTIEIPAALTPFVTKKGAITIDGVSLTVNKVNANSCQVNIIPHTLTATILSTYKLGVAVNIEVDLIARYLKQLIHND